MDKVKYKIRNFITILAVAACLYSASELVRIDMDYHASDAEYADLQKFLKMEAVSGKTDNSGDESGEYPVVDFGNLQKENPDCIAWIYFPDMDINYPILQGEDNEEYLRKSFQGQHLTAGSIFIDSANAPDFSDKNTIVFGHNMRNGSMFGQLKNYKNEQFYKEHQGFYIIAPSGTWHYRIVSCYVADLNGGNAAFQIDFGTAEAYGKFIGGLKAGSLYDTGVGVNTDDRLITLVTCNGNLYDTRMVIHAKKEE